MKSFINYFKSYYKQEWHWVSFVFVTIFTAIVYYSNYQFKWYENYIDNAIPSSKELILYCAFYLFVYLGALLIQYVIKPKQLNRNDFFKGIIIATIAIVLYAFRGIRGLHTFVTEHISTLHYHNIVFKILYNGSGILLICLPAFVYWIFQRKSKEDNFYGFHYKNVALLPYWILLLVMVPAIWWAAQDPSFLSFYPRFQFLDIPATDQHATLWKGLYEVVYSIDYITTELFFRGILVVYLARYLGSHSVLAMCALYVVIHFGKPDVEIISSYFGGLLLGVAAFQSKSIYGGIIVHLGIALLMEIFGMLFLLSK